MASPGGAVPRPSLAGDLISDRRLDDPMLPCRKVKCGILVYVYEDSDTRPPIDNVQTAVIKSLDGGGVGGKNTGNGQADYRGLDPASYTVKVTLPPDKLKDYAWPSTDEASIENTEDVPELIIKAFRFPAVRLARPKIKVIWQMPGDPDDGKPVAGAHVKLQEIAYPDTNAEGISELPSGARGLREATYPVNLTFDKDSIDILDPRSITVPKASTATEIFHVRKCWVEFVVYDQFDRPFEGDADFVLTFPENKRTENGALSAGSAGKVRREGPAGEYNFQLKLLHSAQWVESEAKIGQEATLNVEAPGYEAGDVTFEFFDACSPTGSPLDTVTASKLTGTTAEAKWTPAESKLTAVTSGTVRFIAKAGKQKAVSPAIPILSQRAFKVTGPDGGPLETDLTLSLSDGDEVTARSAGGEAKPWLPVGKRVVAIALPGLSGRVASFQVPDTPGALGSYFPKTS